MKKSILLLTSLLLFQFVGIWKACAQTSGTLTFSFTEGTKTASSTFQSQGKHVLAVWIQDNTGNFVVTKIKNGGLNSTADHLPTWSVNAGGTSNNCNLGNTVTATTGATLSSFSNRSITWDGTNVNGVLVADGTYKVSVEETWNHGGTGTTVRSFTFTKGPNSDIQSPTADGNFSNISLQWIPILPTTVPTASFTTSSNTFCVGQTVQLTNTSTGSPSSYVWDLTGGTPSTSTNQNPTVTYNTAGTYSITLIATNSIGASSPVTQTISVNALPVVSLSNFSPVCVSDAAFTLTGGSPTGGAYSGPGITNNTFTPSIAGVGVQTISYDVTQNGCSNSSTATIQVDACSGISELNSDLLLIYPNPTNGILNLIGKDLQNYKNVNLIDLSGKIIASWSIANIGMTIDLSNQPTGFYNLKFSGYGNELDQKIEIKK